MTRRISSCLLLLAASSVDKFLAERPHIAADSTPSVLLQLRPSGTGQHLHESHHAGSQDHYGKAQRSSASLIEDRFSDSDSEHDDNNQDDGASFGMSFEPANKAAHEHGHGQRYRHSAKHEGRSRGRNPSDETDTKAEHIAEVAIQEASSKVQEKAPGVKDAAEGQEQLHSESGAQEESSGESESLPLHHGKVFEPKNFHHFAKVKDELQKISQKFDTWRDDSVNGKLDDAARHAMEYSLDYTMLPREINRHLGQMRGMVKGFRQKARQDRDKETAEILDQLRESKGPAAPELPDSFPVPRPGPAHQEGDDWVMPPTWEELAAENEQLKKDVKEHKEKLAGSEPAV